LLLCCVVFVSSLNRTHAQNSKTLEELTRKLEELNKQIEGCGSDLGCIQNKMKDIEQITKEIQSLQNNLQKNPDKLFDDTINNLPKENQFPQPFDKITTLFLKHTMASSTLRKIDCDAINTTRKDVLDKVNEIYKKGLGLTGPSWPLPLVRCKETNVKLKEKGVISTTEYYLEYELEFVDKAIWTSDYILLVGDTVIDYSDIQSYKLGLASPKARSSKIIHFSGWILDHSKDPPIQLPLNRYDILEQDIIDIGVHAPSYQGYTMILPENINMDKIDKYKLGKVTNYRMMLPYQIVRFYPDLNTELFIENTELVVDLLNSVDELFTPEQIHTFFQQGKLTKSFSYGGITQNLEIGFPTFDCDEQINSTKGAIVRAGDCIDHGGYVISSDKSTIVNGKPVARIGDKVLCYKHGQSEIISSGNTKVTSNKKQIARIGDKTKCGAKLLGGSMNTFAGDK
jgi:uncharacterized Zn-binding protein involved in type VI secretion/uncharacterized coiled-coil protein SlyX